jgi:hypothetical protein
MIQVKEMTVLDWSIIMIGPCGKIQRAHYDFFLFPGIWVGMLGGN